MAFCANCGRAIADQADVCPNCGHPNEAKQAALAQGGVASTVVVPASQLAGFWRRFAARFIDGILVMIVATILAGGGDNPYNSPAQAVGLLYEWLMLGLNDGRTLGKMVMGVRIAHPDGSKISLGTAFLRTIMTIVSALALLLGYLWAAWDPEKRTWHDMVAKTRAFKK